MATPPPPTTTTAAASEAGEPMEARQQQQQQQQQQGDNRGNSLVYQPQQQQQQQQQHTDRTALQPPASSSQMDLSRPDASPTTPALSGNDSTAAAASSGNQNDPSHRLQSSTLQQQQQQLQQQRSPPFSHYSPPRGGGGQMMNQNVAATDHHHNSRKQQHQQQQHQHMSVSSSSQNHHPFLGDIENDDFGPDVLILPLGSFAEDSPTRGSSDSDEAAAAARMHRRRASPRSSPVVRSITGQLLQPSVPPQQQQQNPQPISLYHYYPPPNHHQYYSQLAHHPQHHHQMQGYAAPPTTIGHRVPPTHQQQQHQAMPYAHPSYGYAPGYGFPPDSSSSSRQQQHHHQQQQWGSPLDDDTSFAPPDVARAEASSPRGSTTTTPEKHKRGRDEVFRSPPSTNKRRSPLEASPGNHTMIGAYGSFGMDTPGAGTTATWGEFSPMGGPAFGGGVGPFDPLQAVVGDKTRTTTTIQFTRSPSGDLQMGPTPCKQEPMLSSEVDQSPFSGFINDFARSPEQQQQQQVPPQPQQSYSGRPLEGVARSPLQSSSERRNLEQQQQQQQQHYHYQQQQQQQHYQPMSTSSAMSAQSYHSSSGPPPPPQGNPKQVRSSAPPAPQNEAKPRKLWPHEPKSAPAVRIELGRGAQRSLEGINSMMRGIQSGGSQQQHLHGVGTTRPHTTPRNDSQRYRLSHPGAPTMPAAASAMYSRPHPANASLKSIAPAPPPSQQRQQSVSLAPAPAPPPPPPRHHLQLQQQPGLQPPGRAVQQYGAPPAPVGVRQVVPQPTSGHRQPSSQQQQKQQQQAYKRQAALKPGDKKYAALTTGKENPKPPVVATMLRRSNPCNCKKSKCLKLYCECFSAELFCQGCNCNDCHNIPQHQEIRDKAIKETKSKNPNAFKPRFNVLASTKEVSESGAGHNMGCRCKRSECLKKYCECFQAGVLCSPKCKCKGCANHAGSQKLIDKRRKMKDVRGAEFAMRVSEEAWKGRKPPPSQNNPPQPVRQGTARMSPPAPAPAPLNRPLPGGNNNLPPMLPGAMRPMSQMAPPPHHHHAYLRPPYIAPQMGQMGFSPLGGMNPRTPGYADLVPPNVGGFPQPPPHAPPASAPAAAAPSTTTAQTLMVQQPILPKITPAPPTCSPRTQSAVRVAFDPSSFRKKLIAGSEEVKFYFGPPPIPAQPRTTALAIFSYLSNKDMSQAALVCKTWKLLAEDKELWNFP